MRNMLTLSSIKRVFNKRLLLLVVFTALFLGSATYIFAREPFFGPTYLRFKNFPAEPLPNNIEITAEFAVERRVFRFFQRERTRDIGKIRSVVLLVDDEPMGVFADNRGLTEGEHTFSVDLSGIEDEEQVKFQLLGYWHSSPERLIKVWKERGRTQNRLVRLLKRIAQLRSEPMKYVKDGNPGDLSKSVNPQNALIQNDPGVTTDNPLETLLGYQEAQPGPMRWIIYEWKGQPKGETIYDLPGYTVEYPSTWQRWGSDGDGLIISEPETTTGISVNFYSSAGQDVYEYFQEGTEAYQRGEVIQDAVISDIVVSGIEGERVDGFSYGSPYVHAGDREVRVAIPLEQYGHVLRIDFLNDKYDEDQSAVFEHFLETFRLLD